MTIYAVQSGTPEQIVAAWPTGTSHRADVLCPVTTKSLPGAAELAQALSELSRSLWALYAEPPLEGDGLGDDAEARYTAVQEAITDPHLPEANGSVLMSYDEPVECAHEVGRVLHALGDSVVAEAVVAEVGVEVDAVQRAGLGDFSGRAAQGVVVEVVDPSPSQVAAADMLFKASPLGHPELFTAVTPAAACVAGVHWLVAAAGVAAEVTGLAADAVFADTDGIEAVSVEVPTLIVKQSAAGLRPREIVTRLLGEAANARDGLTPDPLQLPSLVDAARAEARRVPPAQHDDTLMMLLQRLTPLDPGRASRDLLEHLLDGLRSCRLAYDEAAEDEEAGIECDGEEAAADSGSSVEERITAKFCAAVRDRADAGREQLLA